MVPQAMPISTRNMVITQDIIGTPLMFRSNMSLSPLYNALNTSIANPTHNPSCLSNIFIPSGYNVASIFIPTHTQILSGGPHIPPPPFPRGCDRLGPSISNQIRGASHIVTSSFQIPIGGQPQVGGQPQLGGKPQVEGHNPVYGKSITGLQYQTWNFPFQWNQQPSGGQHPPVDSFVPPHIGKPYP